MPSQDARAVGYGLLGVGIFFVMLGVALFAAFFLGLILGIIPIACGAPLEELGPIYAPLALVASFVGSIFAAVRITNWLSNRRKKPGAADSSERIAPPQA
ncbi:MAG: hypothetical protein ACKVXR_17050 [Planctomycetota bacterium]